jgi:CobQ-like glutamine amidotransferase family enzyme
LAVCGGYQLLAHHFRTTEGTDIPGTGLFDAHTVAGSVRHVGNVVAEASINEASHQLVGFENHSGQTFLHPGAMPLARVVVGGGNNGEDGTEGVLYKHAVGTYLHGPLLPKNPWLADWLLEGALQHRFGPGARLEPLDDAAEQRAHTAVASRVVQRGNVRTSIR